MAHESPQPRSTRSEQEDYYDPCYYMYDNDVTRDDARQGEPDDGEFEILSLKRTSTVATPTPPRSSPCMEEIVRRRTPAWISRLLKTNLPEDVELEDLFSNMLVLGRIAEVIHGVLDSCADNPSSSPSSSPNPSRADQRRGITTGSPYSGGPPTTPYSPSSSRPQHLSLGERPYRVMAHDYDRFCALCARLEIREDSRFSFNDVEQRGAGERIGLCIWDISNALHDKSVTGELPEYVGKVIPKFTEPSLTSRLSPDRASLSPLHKARSRAGVPANETSYGSVYDDRRVDGGRIDNSRVKTTDGKEQGMSGSQHVYEMDASTRVLTSILTPGRGKPKHSKLLNAVMMSDFCDEGKMRGEEKTSPLPKIVDRHDAAGSVEDRNPGEKKGNKREEKRNKYDNNDKKNGRNTRNKRAHDDIMVDVSKFSRDERGDGRGGGNPLGAVVALLRPFMLAAAGAMSVVIVQGVMAARKEKQWRRGMAGRW
jgi:hypothetical protein